MSITEVKSAINKSITRHLGPALVGEFVNRATTFLTGLYLDNQVSMPDKLKRLRLLLFKIHSVIEAAEAAMPIGNLSLCRWLIELQDAAREGDDMLLIFKPRLAEDSLQGAGHRGFFLWSLLDAFKRTVGAATDLFWHDYDVDRLTNSLDRLEKISSDVGSFLALLELDTRRRDKRAGGAPKMENPCFSYGILLKETEAHILEEAESNDRSKGAPLRVYQTTLPSANHH